MKLLIAAFLFAFVLPLAAEEQTALQKADQFSGQKKYDEALKILREYAGSHPEDKEPHDRIQRILRRQGKSAEAIEEYRKLYETDPSAFHGYLYARILESPVEREAKFKEIVAKDPAYVWSHVGLATALLDQDRLQDGIAAAKEGFDKVSDPAELHYIQARIYRRMKDYPAAAASAREYSRLETGADAREFAYAYEWMEVANEQSPEEKLKLAEAWLAKYRADAEKTEGLDGAMRLAELSFIYADQDREPARVRKFAELGSKALAAEEPPASGEERDYYFRTKGSLLALQAWAEARLGGTSRVDSLLKEAEKTGPSSEVFYFTALTQNAKNRHGDAVRNSLKAATYPPVYPGAKDLATKLWKGKSEELEAALSYQRSKFAPVRKKRVLAGEVSQKFEPFELTDPAGNRRTEKDLAGKITLINFWAVWCPPCREELPHWNAFVAQHGTSPDLQLLAVGDEPWETMQNYMKNNNYSFPVFRNEKYWEQFSVEGIPTLVIIDRNGTIRFRNTGFEEGMEYEETLLWQIEAVK